MTGNAPHSASSLTAAQHPQGARRIRSAPRSASSLTAAQHPQNPCKVRYFYPKTSQFRVIARPQSGRGNLKAEGMASRNEAREYETRRNSYHKKQEICCIVPLPRSSFQGFVSFRAAIVRSGMTNRFVKDCRVGRRHPPRNDTKPVGFTKKPTGSLRNL